jgi:ell wall binding domain 2 (CWB2)
MIANETFAAPQNVAIATMSGWQDALTGAAMIGSRCGPLLLTPPSGLTPGLSGYLSIRSASIHTAYILGGIAALPQQLAETVADLVGSPGHHVYDENQPDPSTSTFVMPRRGNRLGYTR